MTARGSLPFAFLFNLYTTLLNLLPDVMTSLKVSSVAVCCPSCNTPKLSLASALHTPTMECFTCPGHPTFDISGLALWSSDDDSLASALAAAHREVLNNTAEAVAMVNVAHTKLVR